MPGKQAPAGAIRPAPVFARLVGIPACPCVAATCGPQRAAEDSLHAEAIALISLAEAHRYDGQLGEARTRIDALFA